MDHLQSFIADCDRRTEVAKKRLAETQEEISAEVAAKVSIEDSLCWHFIQNSSDKFFLKQQQTVSPYFFSVENAFNYFIIFNNLLKSLVVHFTGVRVQLRKDNINRGHPQC